MAVVINASKLRIHANSGIHDRYADLREEQAELQRKLTTGFPSKETMLFDQKLGFLMLNGCVYREKFILALN